MTQTPIRPIVAGDLPALARIAEVTLFPGSLLEGMATPALNGQVPDIWLVADGPSGPVGFAYCRPEQQTDRTWNLLALAVAPSAQGQGAGRALVMALEAALRDHEQRLLIVDTSSAAEQATARAFYARIGFAEVSVIPDFWQAGEDKVTFLRRLEG